MCIRDRVYIEPDESPGRSSRPLGTQCATSVVRAFVRVDRPREVELERRRLLILDHRAMRREVVDVEHDETGFDARQIERPDAGGRDAVRRAGFNERVPHRYGTPYGICLLYTS